MPNSKLPRSTRYRWTRLRDAQGLKRYLIVVGARFGSDVRRPAWIAVAGAFRGASSSYAALQKSCGRPMQALKWRAGIKSPTRTNARPEDSALKPAERRTIELGSCVVLSMLGLGLEVGSWPAWSAPVAIGGYLTWVVVYSEITVQTGRMRAAARRPAIADRLSPGPEAPPA
jgi:hypothetical protein